MTENKSCSSSDVHLGLQQWVSQSPQTHRLKRPTLQQKETRLQPDANCSFSRRCDLNSGDMPKLKARAEELNAGVKLPSRRRGTIREEKQTNHQQSDFRRLTVWKWCCGSLRTRGRHICGCSLLFCVGSQATWTHLMQHNTVQACLTKCYL